MKRLFTPHKEILPPAQQRLWPHLKQAAALGYTLYGGTAIALRLAHRASVDFDFFTEKPLDRDALQSNFPFLAKATVIQEQPNALSVIVSCGDTPEESVKVSFFGEIGFGRVGEPDVTDDRVLHIASLDDLMATKVKTILQRVEVKDYRDIVAMLEAGVSLSKGLAAARAMFGVSFQPSESLKAMVYFEGGDLHTLKEGEKSCLVNAVGEIRDIPHVAILSHQLTA